MLKRHNCRGLFCHTGKPAQVRNRASERMEIISGQRLIDLLARQLLHYRNPPRRR
ncbi:hypothetical protein [Klebsiella pneumoniae]|uniref:hypothetical protein n=1 Tax=Klebsiella pneumoniae TaxID=573 RepID=UPI003D952A1A